MIKIPGREAYTGFIRVFNSKLHEKEYGRGYGQFGDEALRDTQGIWRDGVREFCKTEF